MRRRLLFLICIFCLLDVNQIIAQQFSPVFIETFQNYRSETAGGNFFAEAEKLNLDLKADNKGWNNFQTYESERALKMGDKINEGRLTTPALVFADQNTGATRIKVSFRAQAWAKDTTAIQVSIDGEPTTLQSIILDRNTISDRSLTPYVIFFDAVKPNAKIKFASAKNSYARFFISEIVISELLDTANPHLTLSTNWHQFGDCMTTETPASCHISVEAVGQQQPIRIEPTATPSHFDIEKIDWSPLTGGTLRLSYNPQFAGKHEETIQVIDQNGFIYPIVLRAKSRLPQMEATEADLITNRSFRCNWLPLAKAESYDLRVYSIEEKPLVASELFFSKYIEGASNNRALEVYNGTGRNIDLSEYAIYMENNGLGGLNKNRFTFPKRTLAPGETYLLTDGNMKIAEVKNAADTLIGYAPNGSIFYFTGNDAIGLFKNNTLIDLIGYEDQVAAWGQDRTFYRKAGVYAPQPKFYPEEWIEYGKDHGENAGSHTMNATGDVRCAVISERLSGDIHAFDVTNLEADKTYYYSVMAYSGDLTTSYCTPVLVRTLIATSIDQNVSEKDIRVSVIDGELRIESDHPQQITICQMDGKICKQAYLQGTFYTFSLPTQGIYLIKSEQNTIKIRY